MKIALVIEVPPSSKKSSSIPISRSAGSPRTSWNWRARKRSSGLRGRHARLCGRGAGLLRRGERPAVHLAVLGQGESVQEDEGRGEHVVGQPLGQGLAQDGGIGRVSRQVGTRRRSAPSRARTTASRTPG